MNSFIPAIHLGYTPQQKMTSEWWKEVVHKYYRNFANVNLLYGKNVKEINEYASGDIDMKYYVKMFDKANNRKPLHTSDRYAEVGNDNPFRDGMKYEALAILPNKCNSAIAVVNKIPVEVGVKANDALSAKKKEEDIQFLKNKPQFQEQLQSLSDQMNLGKVDLGTTRHSAIPFSSSPYGLDLNEPDEAQVFSDLLYSLATEAAYETSLQSMWDIKQMDVVKENWIRDQLYYGVSCHSAFSSATTGLPDMDYVFPGDIECPKSTYHDYRDISHFFEDKSMTITDLFNSFGSEIGSKEALDTIMNDAQSGYCYKNGYDTQKSSNYDQFKVSLKYVEIKTIDWVGIAPINKKSRFKIFTTDEDMIEKNGGEKRWFQNTYYAYWLFNTDYFFGIDRLPFAHRELGKESYQNFSRYFFKSVEKSAVELGIAENKKAVVADLKMQHAVLMAKKTGIYLNLKFLRGGAAGLKDNPDYSLDKIVKMALEDNDFVGDTEGFDGQNEGQFKPFEVIPGGLHQDLVGYIQVISDAYDKIGRLTGINEQLTGQSANPLGLVGMQKLLINGSINAMYYMNFAIENQTKNLITTWAHYVKKAIEDGGETKKAIVNLIGSKKANLIDAIDDIPLHQMGIFVYGIQREEERQEYRDNLALLKQAGIITVVDEYMLSAIKNPKDQLALLAVKYKQFEKKAEKQRAEANQQQQLLIQQESKNEQDLQRQKSEDKKGEIYAQGDVSANILKLANQLGLSQSQLDAVIKKSLQQDRGNDQLNKNIQTLETKHNLDQQKPYGE